MENDKVLLVFLDCVTVKNSNPDTLVSKGEEGRGWENARDLVPFDVGLGREERDKGVQVSPGSVSVSFRSLRGNRKVRQFRNWTIIQGTKIYYVRISTG